MRGRQFGKAEVVWLPVSWQLYKKSMKRSLKISASTQKIGESVKYLAWVIGQLISFASRHCLVRFHEFWSNYSDLTRPGPRKGS